MITNFVDYASERPVTLASRMSDLARAQTDIVRARLSPTPTQVLGLSTKGDEILDRPLVEIGGKGVFIKTLEVALLDGRADAAVHSMKDMETEIAPGTAIGAVLPREDSRDALVGPFETIQALPHGAVIGTASVRRSALLRNLRPDLQINLLRGNINTRLARLQAGEFDAIILAVAGLKRLSLPVIYTPLSDAVMPAAAAQGALAIQIRTGNERADALAPLFAQLNCAETHICVTAERAVLAAVDGSCRTPLSAMARLDGDAVHVTACVLSEDGQQKFEARANGPASLAADIGNDVGRQLLDLCGGRQFLA